MGPRTARDTTTLSPFRDRLAALPGVSRVIVDEAHPAFCLICTPQHTASVESAAREILADLRDDVDLEIVTRPADQRSDRVRFDGVEVAEEADRKVRVRVRLEWDGQLVTGDAVGERGEAIELRTAVTAALEGLEVLTGKPLGLRIAGVKRIRAFDAELMVVSLYRPGMPSQKVVGSVLVGAEPHRAAALALLAALNRLLGNYLSR